MRTKIFRNTFYQSRQFSKAIYIKLAALVLVTLSLISCGEEAEPGNVSLYVTGSIPYLIPGEASSCDATYIALGTGTKPEKNIQPSYFEVTKLTLARGDTSKVLRVSYISIGQADGTGEPIFYANDSLYALHKTWWTARSATMDAGVKSFSTDCSVFLGGFPKGVSTSGSVIIEIVGVEGEGEESKPFKASVTADYSAF